VRQSLWIRKKEEGRRKKEEGRIIPTFPFSYFPVFSSPFFPPQVRQSLWIRKKEEGRRKKEEGRRKKEELSLLFPFPIFQFFPLLFFLRK
jgi:hypothetical protein